MHVHDSPSKALTKPFNLIADSDGINDHPDDARVLLVNLGHLITYPPAISVPIKLVAQRL